MLDEFIMVLPFLKISFLLTDTHKISNNVTFKNLLVHRNSFPSLMVLFILMTCLLENVRILLGEITSKSFLGSSVNG